MTRLQIEIEKRKQLLLERKKSALARERHAPKGILRAFMNKNTVQYCIREGAGDRNGVYLPKNQIEKARALARHERDTIMLKLINAELKLLDKLSRQLHKDPWLLAKSRMSKLKAALLDDDDEMSGGQYAASWLAAPFEPSKHQITSDLYSGRGIRVRSKSELLIANMLEEYGLVYLYERPVTLGGLGKVYPDFTILRPGTRDEVIWEHFGLLDDEEYRKSCFWKLRAYEASGYIQGLNLIVTFETKEFPLDTRSLPKIIEANLL